MPTYTPLQSIVLTSATSSITFSGIPQTYQDLVVVVQGKVTSSIQDLQFRINGDSGSNYCYVVLSGNGSSATSQKFSSQSAGGGDSNGYLDTVIYNASIHNFMNYSNTTTFKSIISRSNNAGTGIDALANIWNSTSAITSLTFYPTNSVNFAAGCTFDLYGISPVAAQVASASGGTDIFYDSTYVYHVFKGSGVFTPTRNLTADYLVIAGGAGGATGITGSALGGGGGAGGFRSATSQSLTNGTSYTVTVGAGGAPDTNGANSSFSTFSSTGGGTGSSSGAGTSGGSGGGGRGSGAGSGTWAGGAGNAGSYSPVEGYAGGQGSNVSPYQGGGGGGAAQAGQTSGTGGNGSNAFSSWATATNTGVSGYYAGGGGGGVTSPGTAQLGGSGGGGTGARTANTSSTAGVTNTGSGGGGGADNNSGQLGGSNGGSGLVIIRYAR